MNDICSKSSGAVGVLEKNRRRGVWFRRFFFAALAFLFLAAIFWRSALYVSPETTMIITPLKSDGYPNYISQLDIPQNCKDYTSEENGFTILTRECGPGLFFNQSASNLSGDVRIVNPDYAAFCASLGLSHQDSYPTLYYDVFEAICLTVKNGSDANSSENHTCLFLTHQLRPWKAAEYPLVAKALEKNTPVYELLYQASEKRWFNPVLNTLEGGAFSGSFKTPGAIEPILRELLFRSALRAGEGDWDGATDDLIVCWKLGRLTNQTPLWNNLLEGFRIEQQAFALADTFLNADMPESGRKKLREALKQLPPIPDAKQYVYNIELQFYSRMIGAYKKSQKWIQYNAESKIDWIATVLNLFPADYNIIGNQVTQWRQLLDKAVEQRNPQWQAKLYAGIDAQINLHRKYREKIMTIPVSVFIVPRSQILGNIEAEGLIGLSRNIDNFLNRMKENQKFIIEKSGK